MRKKKQENFILKTIREIMDPKHSEAKEKALLWIIGLVVVVGSIVRFANTNNASYLIAPIVILGWVALETSYVYFRDQK